MSEITILGSEGTVKHIAVKRAMYNLATRQFRDLQLMFKVFELGGDDALRKMARNLDGILCQTILHVSADTAETFMVVLRQRVMEGKAVVRNFLKGSPLDMADSMIDMRIVLEDCATREGWRHVGIAVVYTEFETKPAIPNGIEG